MPTSTIFPDAIERAAMIGCRRPVYERNPPPVLWLKAFHIIFMVTWFAGLFYLPRLFVYHCAVNDATGQARFCTMERKLFLIMTIGAAATVFFGIVLISGIMGIHGRPELLDKPWMRAKLLLALGLIAYHVWLWLICRDFANYRNRHSAKFFRWANEVPALFLIGMVLLAVLKPD
jgi:putative membrane protein